MNEDWIKDYKLIITIVKKGKASKIVEASKKAGARGGTIIYGKGKGIHEQKKFFGLEIEPEKEMILTLVPHELVDKVLKSIEEAGSLNKPRNGIGFVIDAKKISGIAHILR